MISSCSCQLSSLVLQISSPISFAVVVTSPQYLSALSRPFRKIEMPAYHSHNYHFLSYCLLGGFIRGIRAIFGHFFSFSTALSICSLGLRISMLTSDLTSMCSVCVHVHACMCVCSQMLTFFFSSVGVQTCIEKIVYIQQFQIFVVEGLSDYLQSCYFSRTISLSQFPSVSACLCLVLTPSSGSTSQCLEGHWLLHCGTKMTSTVPDTHTNKSRGNKMVSYDSSPRRKSTLTLLETS